MEWMQVLADLESGKVRSANQLANGKWQTNVEVKQAILAAFKHGENINYSDAYTGFVDKNSMPPRQFAVADRVRLVPGGSSVRSGAHIAKGVVIMPPSYVNVGAFVDSGTMIDSHVLVGSCAQIGKNVHLSAGVQIGGVLEPVGMQPVIIEDDVFIGAGAVIVEGIVIGKRAVIAPGVVLSNAVPVYDCIKQCVYERGADIPENAVVIPGSREVSHAWGKEQNLQINCPIIIKYRDDKSDASLLLEESLR